MEHPVHINWFPYYAGYNSDFVFDVLGSLKIRQKHNVLDPWNGSGTTTTTAYRVGASAIGCDINPVMVVAAKSALLEPGAAPSLLPLAQEILSNLPCPLIDKQDPLCTWFGLSSAAEIRRIQMAIWRILVKQDAPPNYRPESISTLSTIAAFYLTALFRTTRKFLSPFVGSNPTWIREPKTLRNRLRPAQSTLWANFVSEVEDMSERLRDASKNGLKDRLHGVSPVVKVASSTALPFEVNEIDAVVSSPPYLTRIDYAVATKPELAVLGMSFTDHFASFRKTMLGAPSVRRTEVNERKFGKSCDSFLRSVKVHPSKGSENYYHKLYSQYFEDLQQSLKEIHRVLKRRGRCVLVVQDSYYKEIHADLAQFTTELAESAGLTKYDRNDFKWKRNMVQLNSRSRRYRTPAESVESVLWFSRN